MMPDNAESVAVWECSGCRDHPVADSPSVGPLCKLHAQFLALTGMNFTIVLREGVTFDTGEDEDEHNDGSPA